MVSIVICVVQLGLLLKMITSGREVEKCILNLVFKLVNLSFVLTFTETTCSQDFLYCIKLVYRMKKVHLLKICKQDITQVYQVIINFVVL